jgi:HupE / UreJ protein
VGLPQHAIPVALLFFNVGVEIGQLVFVAAVLSSLWLLGHAAS